ncbi:MAG: hypothetical protein ACRC8S_19530 [Fimbriiglobus sp.]
MKAYLGGGGGAGATAPVGLFFWPPAGAEPVFDVAESLEQPATKMATAAMSSVSFSFK